MVQESDTRESDATVSDETLFDLFAFLPWLVAIYGAGVDYDSGSTLVWSN
jgi:hypothetical protein